MRKRGAGGFYPPLSRACLPAAPSAGTWLRILTLILVVVSWSSASAEEFKDCPDCPVMVTIPAGTFNRALFADAPQQQVDVPSFALAKFEVSVAEFEVFLAASGWIVPPGCRLFTLVGLQIDPDATWMRPGFMAEARTPAVCISWEDATAYTAWLAARTGLHYRLPSEAEWDYAAHAGSPNDVSYYLRANLRAMEGNCQNCGGFDMMGHGARLFALPVGSYPSNPLGLHDIMGNGAEWTADCFNPSFDRAPVNGSPWLQGDCNRRVVRGGAWYSIWAELAGYRRGHAIDWRDNGIGFRVARDLAP